MLLKSLKDPRRGHNKDVIYSTFIALGLEPASHFCPVLPVTQSIPESCLAGTRSPP